MKILHIMGGANDGGAEIFFADALLALNNKKIDQQAIVNKCYKKINQLDNLSISIHQASFNKIFKWSTKKIIEKVVADFKPDIIHYWMGRASSFMIKGPHVNIGWHSGYRGVERFRGCDFHLALTKELKAHLVNHKLPEKNIFILPIYAPYLKAESIKREVFNTPIKSPLLLTMARLHPVKGLDILLDAMVEIPKAYLWIAGSGELESQLKQQAKKLGIENRIKFLGWRDDKEALMAAADLFVFPSRNDAFGAVMLEAWAHKIPFIATKAPGPKAYIKNKIDGVLVDIDSPKKLSKAIKMTINNIPLQKKLIKNGYKRYQKEFTEKAFVLNVTNIYKEILNLQKIMIKKILIIKHGALGDMIQADGMMQDIRRTYPKVRIILLTTKPHAELYKHAPFIDEIIIDARKPFWKVKSIIDLASKLLDLNIDKVIDLQNSRRTRYYKKFILNKIQWNDTSNIIDEDSGFETQLTLLRNMGVKIKFSQSPNIQWTTKNVSKLLGNQNIRRKFVVLIPGSSKRNQEKRWPHFPLLEKLLIKNKISVLTLLGDEETNLESSFPGPVLTTLSWFELAGCLNESSFVIGNDSGPTFLASYLNKKGLALFGPTTSAKATSIFIIGSFKAIEADNLEKLKPIDVYNSFKNF